MDKKYLEKSKHIINQTYPTNKIENQLVCLGDESEILKTEAQKRRKESVGEDLFVRASLEHNNLCSNSCSFCGMSKDNKKLRKYMLSFEESKSVINDMEKMNIRQLHLVGGESNKIDIYEICRIVKYASSQKIYTTIILGELSEVQYQQLYEAGATRYILKFETSNEKLFYSYKSNKSLEERIANLFLLKDIGFKIGTGIIVGLPKTTISDLAKDLFILKEINPDMASASVFSPNAESILKDEMAGSFQIALNFIALTRINLLDTPVISCSSSFGLEGQCEALSYGANLMSCHVTPKKHVENFSMYRSENRIKTQYEEILYCAMQTGLKVSEYV